MKKNDHLILIHKSLTGELSNGDNKKLEEWRNDPQHEKIYQELKMIWENAEEDYKPLPVEVKRIEGHFLASRLRNSKKNESLKTKYRGVIRNRNLLIGLMILINSVLFYLLWDQQNTVPQITEVTVKEQHETILPDHSEVILNQGSSFTYTQAIEERKLSLEGEAYFKVEKDENRPFIIDAGEATIRVTGTSFIVKAYPDQTIQVILISGRVDVTYLRESVELKRENEMAFVQNGLHKGVNQDPNFNSWYTKDLSFDDTELREILHHLEKMYDVSFVIPKEKLLECRFSGEFQDEQNVDVILKILSLTLDIRFEKEGTVYTLIGNKCN